MPDIIDLELYVHTRDEEEAETSGRIRLLSGDEEVLTFEGPVPARGKGKQLHANLRLDRDDFLARPISLALTNDDRWAPRAAFLRGNIVGIPRPHWPLAQNFSASPNAFVSQNALEGMERWPMYPITPAGEADPLRHLVVVTYVLGFGTTSPLEFALFGRADGFPVVVYRTVLARMGLQDLDESHYACALLQRHGGNDFTRRQLSAVRVAVRGDDPWHARGLWVYGLNNDLSTGRLLGSGWLGLGAHVPIFSQDPNVVNFPDLPTDDAFVLPL